MMLPVETVAFGTIFKTLIKGLKDFEIRERVETTQTTALFRCVRILRRVFEEIWCHSNSCERQPANAGVKNSQEVKE